MAERCCVRFRRHQIWERHWADGSPGDGEMAESSSVSFIDRNAKCGVKWTTVLANIAQHLVRFNFYKLFIRGISIAESIFKSKHLTSFIFESPIAATYNVWRSNNSFESEPLSDWAIEYRSSATDFQLFSFLQIAITIQYGLSQTVLHISYYFIMSHNWMPRAYLCWPPRSPIAFPTHTNILSCTLCEAVMNAYQTHFSFVVSHSLARPPSLRWTFSTLISSTSLRFYFPAQILFRLCWEMSPRCVTVQSYFTILCDMCPPSYVRRAKQQQQQQQPTKRACGKIKILICRRAQMIIVILQFEEGRNAPDPESILIK